MASFHDGTLDTNDEMTESCLVFGTALAASSFSHGWRKESLLKVERPTACKTQLVYVHHGIVVSLEYLLKDRGPCSDTPDHSYCTS